MPATEMLRTVLTALDGAGIAAAVGGSGILAAPGLAGHVRDWDLIGQLRTASSAATHWPPPLTPGSPGNPDTSTARSSTRRTGERLATKAGTE
jgi:hypothetical protein